MPLPLPRVSAGLHTPALIVPALRSQKLSQHCWSFMQETSLAMQLRPPPSESIMLGCGACASMSIAALLGRKASRAQATHCCSLVVVVACRSGGARNGGGDARRIGGVARCRRGNAHGGVGMRAVERDEHDEEQRHLGAMHPRCRGHRGSLACDGKSARVSRCITAQCQMQRARAQRAGCSRGRQARRGKSQSGAAPRGARRVQRGARRSRAQTHQEEDGRGRPSEWRSLAS